MAGDNAGTDRLTAPGGAPAWDRFAHWRPAAARLLLFGVAALLLLAALAPYGTEPETGAALSASAGPATPTGTPTGTTTAAAERDEDLALYRRAVARIAGGEAYYDFIVGEQRQRNYPVRPGIAVRLPTLAYLHAGLGEGGLIALAILLLAACVWAWWRRLGEEPGGKRRQLIGTALMLMGGALGLNRYFFVLHELWAGMLMALAFGLHRPGRWGAALGVAALALAIRELALPFVLLLGAMALWRRDWREAGAWAALVAVYLALLGWHLALIAGQVLPSDPLGPSWLALRGLSGWLGNVAESSDLRFLPPALAGPVVLLAMLGWAGWKSPAGTTATLLYGGYGIAFMVVGRENNYYWGMMVAPALFIGLAFLPMALRSLLASARGRAPHRAGQQG